MFATPAYISIRSRARLARGVAALVASLAIAVVSGCGRGDRHGSVAPAETATGGVAVDDFGDTVRLGAPPARIVSLNPTTTEVLFALGAGGRLVGRTHWDVYPDSARRVPDLGPGIEPNVEAVVAAYPDLVVLYATPSNRRAAAALRAAHVPVVTLRIDRADQFAHAVRLLGRVTATAGRADTLADTVLATLARVRAATALLPRPRTLWPLIGEPLYVIGGGSFLSELLETAGATNAFGDLAQPAAQVSREEVVRRGADLIIAGPRGAARLRADPVWRGLAAVRNDRILVVDTALFLRPSVQLGMAATQLAERIHPGALAHAGAPATAGR